MKTIGWVISFLVVLAGGIIYSGVALSIMWGWFIAPVFNAPLLTIPYAIGLTMTVGYMTKEITPNKNNTSAGKQLLEALMVAIIKPTFGLVFGYVVTLFI